VVVEKGSKLPVLESVYLKVGLHALRDKVHAVQMRHWIGDSIVPVVIYIRAQKQL
jgi:hypothetical protein